MKIKMLTLSAGPDGVHPAGSVMDLQPEKAQELIRGGFAVAVEVKKAAPVRPQPEIETAEAAPPPEQAVVSAGKKSSGKKPGKK